MGSFFGIETGFLLLAAWLLTLGITLTIIRRQELRNRRMRRRNKRLMISRECVLKLLDKANESLQDSVELPAFLHYFTEYASRSMNTQSAAFFQYNSKERLVKAEAIVGVFPTLINVPQKMLNVLTSSPGKLQAYLYNTSFSLAETPFAESILQQYAIKMDKKQVEERIRYKVFDCWGMMIIPVTAQNRVFGVLVLANKFEHGEFTDEDLDLAKNLSEMAGITINHILSFEDLQDKMLIDNQFQTAEIIQSHLLPENIHISDKYEFAVHYQPAYRLGGDYYDFIEVDDDHIGILVADVSGKGIPAGLVMATTRSLAAVLTRGELSPRRVLIQLNNYLHRLIPENMFVTVSYAVLNKNTREIVCARAGHEPLICCFGQKGMCVLGGGKGMVVGMVDDEIFSQSLENESYQLEPGDMVLFYTDGVTEAHNPDGEEFGRQRLGRILDTVKELDACNAMECLIHRITRFMEDEAPYDDITLVLIKVK